jgi:hypothetical protein
MVKSIIKNRIETCISMACEERPVTVATLAPCSDPHGQDRKRPTCPKTRKLIRELITEGKAIGSNSKGYFPIETGEQLQRYLNKLLKRQVAIAGRISDVHKAFFKNFEDLRR